MKMKKMNSKVRKMMMVCGAAGLLALGGTSAYLTDYDQAVNEFTVGKVEIDLTEPDWKPDEHTKVTPTEDIKKNPKITNTGENEAYVYLQVSIPKANVITADASGNREAKANKELFTFTKNSGWVLIDSKDGDTARVYTYAYDQILKAGQTTGTLFDKVTFINVIEGQLDTKHLNIPVKAYAIQTSNTGGDGVDTITKAQNAFQKYVKQNENQDGKIMQ